MRLWLKIALVAIIMVTLATGLCSFFLLLSFGKSNLDRAVESTLTEQKMRAASWTAAMENSLDRNLSPTAQRSLARYSIDKFADRNTVLVTGDDFIYNATDINPIQLLSVEGVNQHYIIRDMESGTLLIVGSNLTINEIPYTLYVMKNIHSVYSEIEEMTKYFAFINLGVIALTGVFTLVLVRFMLRPVSTLKKTTELLAAGNYDKRVKITEEDEIGELATHFNTMAQAIEKHVGELREEAEKRTLFMSALTHELKTPMTAISGYAQTLLHTKMEEEEREEALLVINEECTRVERLSQKLMELIVLRRRDSIVLEAQPVAELFETVRQASSRLLQKQSLTLTLCNRMTKLPMDRDLLSSLLLNLIDNGGKASSSGKIIELLAQGNTLYVVDHGKGIPSEEVSKITRPFYMVDKSRSKKSGGMGLGLALCEEIARLHQARLEFEETPGGGTTVKVVFNHA